MLRTSSFTAAALALLAAGACREARPGWRFIDITREAGIADERNSHFGATWSDFDADGILDFYVVNWDRNQLFRGVGDCRFVNVTEATGAGDPFPAMRNVWADYDRDGDLDFYSHNFEQSTLYRNEGGRFVDANEESGAGVRWAGGTGAAWGDYDGDGWLDLHLTEHNESSLQAQGHNAVLHNNADGTFSDVTAAAALPTTADATGDAWGDYDNDGCLDLANGVAHPDEHLLFHNRCDGTFEEVSRAAGVSTEPGSAAGPVVWGDTDNDGFLDLLVGETVEGSTKSERYPLRLYLFHNQGDGTFVEVAREVGLDPEPRSFWDAGFADWDNDGDLDLAVASWGYALLYENQGDGTFVEVAWIHGVEIDARGMVVAFGDCDADGDLDMYYGPYDDRASHEVSFWPGGPVAGHLFRNEDAGNHWLQVELRGTESNLDAIGAKLELRAGGRLTKLEVNGGRGLFTQDTPIQQLGLGAASVAEELRVIWPSGIVDVLHDVAADQRIRIVEGEASGT